jgi:hypothetical protein
MAYHVWERARGLRPDERLAISSQGKDSTLRIPLLAGDIMSSLSSCHILCEHMISIVYRTHRTLSNFFTCSWLVL